MYVDGRVCSQMNHFRMAGLNRTSHNQAIAHEQLMKLGPLRTHARSLLGLAVSVASLLGLGLEAAASGQSAGQTPDFSRDVRPLLEQHCIKCHGPEKQKGGLRLDTKEGAFKAAESGEKAIVPGHATESR